MKTLAGISEHTLEDIYFAEQAIARAFPQVIRAASNASLKRALQNHLRETKAQVGLLEQVFTSIGRMASGEKCDAIERLITR